MDPDAPGEWTHLETCAETDGVAAVSTTFHHSKERGLGNIVWAHDLLVSNQDRMYGQLVQSVVQEIKATIGQCNPTEPPATSSLFSFDVVRVAGDGKCFWRAILASQDIESFKLIPRTASFASQEMSKYVTIYIYICTYLRYCVYIDIVLYTHRIRILSISLCCKERCIVPH